MGKKKSKRDKRTSSGLSRDRRISRAIMKTNMKIKKWDRYKSEILSHKRVGDVKRWDTKGLEKHVKYLQGLL